MSKIAIQANIALGRIPKGFRPPAQGWEERPTLGRRSDYLSTPTGLRPFSRFVKGNGIHRMLRVGILGSSNGTTCCNPFRVENLSTALPRVAPASQPWAKGRYPFGVWEPCASPRINHWSSQRVASKQHAAARESRGPFAGARSLRHWLIGHSLVLGPWSFPGGVGAWDLEFMPPCSSVVKNPALQAPIL
jgi:hypothetical protein